MNRGRAGDQNRKRNQLWMLCAPVWDIACSKNVVVVTTVVVESYNS